jgi:dTDP-4-amino-4,6-dideoxygalactose transaminase
MKNLPINDLDRHFKPLREELASATQRVLERGWYILGPEVQEFEREFRDCSGTSEVVSVANGTDALEIGLRSLGVRAGDRVLTTANAGAYSSMAILAAGAVPVFADVDPERLTLSPGALAQALVGGGVQAVVVTHLYGRMAEMPELMRVAKRHGVPVLEDCAQAHGARLAGKPAGSWGHVSAYSFYPTKNLGALGDGGAVATSLPEVARAARELRQYGWSTKYHVGRPGGRNSRLDELQAAYLRVMLPKLEGWNKRRGEIAGVYARELTGTDLMMERLTGKSDVVHLLVCRSNRRDAIRNQLLALGVGCEFHYPIPDHFQPGLAIQDRPRLAVTEAWCAETFTLPCFPEMTDTEVCRVADALRNAVGAPAVHAAA